MVFNPFSIIVTLLILTFIVFFHELGHFSAAKFFKMEVREFAIGFGKVIFRKRYKDTNYSIRLIPLGGFVELEGELTSNNPNNFRNRPYHQKVIVLAAGVFMNIVLAVILLSIYLASSGYKFPITKLADFNFTNTESQQVYSPITVTKISEDSPVKDILSIGDTIVKVNGESYKNYEEFFKKLEASQGKDSAITLIDINTFETRELNLVMPFKSEEGAILKVELSPSNQEAYFIKYRQNILSGFAMTSDIFFYQISALGQMFSNAVNTGNYSEVGNSVGGVVQVADTVNTVVGFSEYSFLVALTAFISISLAFFNILPIPALDGGHILIITIERITRRKLSDKWLNIVTTVGFGFLILLAVLVTLKDVILLF